MKRDKWILLPLVSVVLALLSASVYAEEGNTGKATADQAIHGSAAARKKIFDSVCSYCHKSDSYEEKFGPGLKGITERVDEVWLNKWLKDPRGMLKSDDYAKSLKEGSKYGMSMPQIPDMQDEQKRADVIEFLKTL